MNKTTEALKLAEEALNAMLTHMGMDEDEWTKPTFNQAREALAAIREALAEQSKCACDSPAWCTKYKKCNREMLGLPKAEPVKQEPVAFVDDDGFAWGYGIEGGKLPSGTKLYAKPEQSPQNPVANLISFHSGTIQWLNDNQEWLPVGTKLYAAPVSAKREWVDLTDDEMWDVFINKDWTGEPLQLMSAVIAAFKEKNK